MVSRQLNCMVAALAAGLLLTTACLPNRASQEIADLELMPQSPLAYLSPDRPTPLFIEPGRQQEMADEFLDRFFAPWHSEGPLETTLKPFWAVEWISDHPVFAENLRPLPPDRARELIRQAYPQAYPSLHRRAITLGRCDLRALPTASPLFNDPNDAGQGFPFDTLQHGAISGNTPVLVTHRSLDGAWFFVETAHLYGWLPATALAWVDADFVEVFVTERYLALTRDQVAISDTEGIYRFSAGIGTLLPVTGGDHEGTQVLIAVADQNRQAHGVAALIAPDQGELFPLPLNARRIAGLAGHMMGQPYGWGELFAQRDCSATVRDLFAPFGLWLPRNSSQQAQIGTLIPLGHLPPHQREEQLLATGIPFLTLVHIPGHIMLYIGDHQGRAAVLHTLWGLRTRTLLGREGRLLVGKTVITGLEPGLERDSLLLDIRDLRSRIPSINILLPQASPL